MEEKKRFSLIYLERGKPAPDSVRLRNRLKAYYFQSLDAFHDRIIREVNKELGLDVRYMSDFFNNSASGDILDFITIVHDILLERAYYDRGKEWIGFVRRIFREENLCYRLDDKGVVHYLVDEEFERNRASVLKSLEAKRYGGVRTAFEDAHRHLDSDPMDTKSAVRSMFESIEILSRLMVPETKNLNKWVVQNPLKKIAREKYSHDEIALKTIDGVLDGIGEWVDALHNYRHGQGKEEPVAPPLEFAVYVLSSGASLLRWLIELDSK